MRQVRARYLFARREVRGAAAPLASATKDGVLLREHLEQGVWNPGDDISTYKLVEPGERLLKLFTEDSRFADEVMKHIRSATYQAARAKALE